MMSYILKGMIKREGLKFFLGDDDDNAKKKYEWKTFPYFISSRHIPAAMIGLKREKPVKKYFRIRNRPFVD